MANLATALGCNRKTYVRDNAFEIMTRLTTMNKISTKIAASLANDPETPIFIIGTPGNGKTFTIQSICNEFGYETIYQDMASLNSGLFEVDLLKKVKENPNKRYVLLFDDIDYQGVRRRFIQKAIELATTRTIEIGDLTVAIPNNVSIVITSNFSLESKTIQTLFNPSTLTDKNKPYLFKIFNLDEGFMD